MVNIIDLTTSIFSHYITYNVFTIIALRILPNCSASSVTSKKRISVAFHLGTKRSSLFAYRVTLILNDRVIIKGVQDIMKKKVPYGPTERERHV